MYRTQEIVSISLPNENWIEIFDNRYAVSDKGRVASIKSRHSLKEKVHILKPYISCGYLKVHIHYGSVNKTVSVHRLVAEAFVPNTQSLDQVNHKDGDKANNCKDNLEWCSPKYNSWHRTNVLNKKPKRYKLEESCYGIKVAQYTRMNELVCVYHSIQVASSKTGIESSNISRCANGKRKTAGGYIWKIYELSKRVENKPSLHSKRRR